MKLAPALAAFALGPGPNLSSEALAPRTDPSAGRRPRPRRLLADDLDALPWSDLASRLTGSLVAASAAAYVDECYPPLRDLPRSDRTNHALIDRPSGLCMDHLFCAYERCNPQPEFHANEVNATVNAFALAPYYADPPFGPDDEAVLDGWLDPSNPSYNLPRRVVFPAVAADVVAAVAFAKEHGVKVSVKNSGHSYAGSSTARDSLLVNMNRYERYALASDDEGIGADEVGVEECAAATTTDDEGTTTLEGQPCRLARARGKPAVLRVGGGENFDKVGVLLLLRARRCLAVSFFLDIYLTKVCVHRRRPTGRSRCSTRRTGTGTSTTWLEGRPGLLARVSACPVSLHRPFSASLASCRAFFNVQWDGRGWAASPPRPWDARSGSAWIKSSR